MRYVDLAQLCVSVASKLAERLLVPLVVGYCLFRIDGRHLLANGQGFFTLTESQKRRRQREVGCPVRSSQINRFACVCLGLLKRLPLILRLG